MRAALPLEAGPTDNIEIHDVEPPVAGSDEVIVDVAATALNFMDTLIIRDRYPVKPTRRFHRRGDRWPCRERGF